VHRLGQSCLLNEPNILSACSALCRALIGNLKQAVLVEQALLKKKHNLSYTMTIFEARAPPHGQVLGFKEQYPKGKDKSWKCGTANQKLVTRSGARAQQTISFRLVPNSPHSDIKSLSFQMLLSAEVVPEAFS
jgi:hypothetical protein